MNNYRKIIIAWCCVAGIPIVADEHNDATPPPPAVQSGYFSASASTDSHGDNSHNEESSHDVAPSASQLASSPMPSSLVKAPAPADQTASPAVPDAPLAPAQPAVQVSVSTSASSSNEKAPEQESNTNSTNSNTETPHDNDASTGIQGAHVTKGIDFEPSSDEDVFSMGGVDTTHVKHVSGNWVEKKHYWHEIEEVVDQVKEKIADIGTQRTTFFTTRSEVDKELSTFYQHVGLDQGPLQDMVHYALEIMEKEKEKQGFLNKKERAFYEKAQAKQRIFEQLKEDVKAIGVIDTKIDEALDIVLKQINACNEYEGEVWNIYKTVAYELSEKEAEQHYLVAKAFLKDIENIQMYLAGPFQIYFQELAQSIQTHTQNIVMQLDALEKEGLDLKKEATIFETEEENAQKVQSHEQDAKKSEEKQLSNASDKKKVVKETKKFSIMGYITHIFTVIKNSIVSMVEKVTGLFKGLYKKSDLPVAKKPSVNQEKAVVQEGSEQPVSHAAESEATITPAHDREEVMVHVGDDETSQELEHQEVSDELVQQPVESHREESVVPSHEKKVTPVAKKSELKEALRYDEERFAQEMEELRKSIEAGAHEVMEAPGEVLHSFEQKL